MSMRKKITAVILSLTILVALSGCGTAEEWEPFFHAVEAALAGEEISSSSSEEDSEASEQKEPSFPEVPVEEPSSESIPVEESAASEEPPAESSIPEESEVSEIAEDDPGPGMRCYVESANPMLGDVEAYYPSLALASDGSFQLICNLYEGISSMSGTFVQDETKVVCTVTQIDFWGFVGDDTTEFTLMREGDHLVMADDVTIGATAKGSVFYGTAKIPKSMLDYWNQK